MEIVHTSKNPRTLEVVQAQMEALNGEYHSPTVTTERKAELEAQLRALEKEQDDLLFAELNRPPLQRVDDEPEPTA